MAIDAYNREVFCLGMQRAPKRKPKIKEPGAEEDEDVQVHEEFVKNNLLKESNKGASEWRNINTDSDIDDITSDGGEYSAITPSPMSYNAVEGPFVDDFNGKAIA